MVAIRIRRFVALLAWAGILAGLAPSLVCAQAAGPTSVLESGCAPSAQRPFAALPAGPIGSRSPIDLYGDVVSPGGPVGHVYVCPRSGDDTGAFGTVRLQLFGANSASPWALPTRSTGAPVQPFKTLGAAVAYARQRLFGPPTVPGEGALNFGTHVVVHLLPGIYGRPPASPTTSGYAMPAALLSHLAAPQAAERGLHFSGDTWPVEVPPQVCIAGVDALSVMIVGSPPIRTGAHLAERIRGSASGQAFPSAISLPTVEHATGQPARELYSPTLVYGASMSGAALSPITAPSYGFTHLSRVTMVGSDLGVLVHGETSVQVGIRECQFLWNREAIRVHSAGRSGLPGQALISHRPRIANISLIGNRVGVAASGESGTIAARPLLLNTLLWNDRFDLINVSCEQVARCAYDVRRAVTRQTAGAAVPIDYRPPSHSVESLLYTDPRPPQERAVDLFAGPYFWALEAGLPPERGEVADYRLRLRRANWLSSETGEPSNPLLHLGWREATEPEILARLPFGGGPSFRFQLPGLDLAAGSGTSPVSGGPATNPRPLPTPGGATDPGPSGIGFNPLGVHHVGFSGRSSVQTGPFVPGTRRIRYLRDGSRWLRFVRPPDTGTVAPGQSHTGWFLGSFDVDIRMESTEPRYPFGMVSQPSPSGQLDRGLDATTQSVIPRALFFWLPQRTFAFRTAASGCWGLSRVQPAWHTGYWVPLRGGGPSPQSTSTWSSGYHSSPADGVEAVQLFGPNGRPPGVITLDLQGVMARRVGWHITAPERIDYRYMTLSTEYAEIGPQIGGE